MFAVAERVGVKSQGTRVRSQTAHLADLVVLSVVVVLEERQNPYKLPAIARHNVLSETPQQLRLEGLRNRPKDSVYCLSDEAAWTNVQLLHSGFQQALDNLANYLRALGHYPNKLKQSGGVRKGGYDDRTHLVLVKGKPNPLSPTVIDAYDPDYDRFLELADWRVYPEQPSRSRIVRHTPQMLRIIGEFNGKEYESPTSQAGHFVCPDDAAWERYAELHDLATAASRSLQTYLKDLGTYAAASIDGRYHHQQSATTAQTAVATKSKPAAERLLEAHKPEAVTCSNPHPSPPDPLATLAAQINELHSQGCEAEETAIAAGKAALQLRKEEGDRLLEAKAQLKHGQWGKWLKANCPDISERSCQLYMQLAEGWEEYIAKNETVADLTLKEAIALLPKKTKALPKPAAAPSPLDYTPLSEPKPCWFKVGDTWTEGQAIAKNQRDMVRIVWGEERESDISLEQVQWSAPEQQSAVSSQQSAVSAETKAGLDAAGLAIYAPSITPTEFNREMWGDKSFTPSTHQQNVSIKPPNIDRLPEPEMPTVRLKVKRGVDRAVEILSAIVQCNGITHYLQPEDIQMEE